MSLPLYFLDDDSIQLQLVKMMLNRSNIACTPTFETSIELAFDYFTSCGEDQYPKHIFIDYQMPSLNGIEFITALIDKCPELINTSAIYLLSSASKSELENELKEILPAVKVMSKPLSEKQIQEILC